MFKNELELVKLIDHTLLKPNVSAYEMKTLCAQAKEYNFKAVAVNQVWTKFCSNELMGSTVLVDIAIGFPLGQITIESKVSEATNAINNGAKEIDYVINYGKLLEKDYKYIEEEMTSIVNTCKKHNVISKVIFETGYLQKEDIIAAAKIASKVLPDFIKTSTGFHASGATIDDIKLMKEYVGDKVKVKASGGVRDLNTLIEMVKAGASRIGSSSGIEIVEEYRALQKTTKQ